MNLLTTITIDIARPLPLVVVHAKQNDTARSIAVKLVNNGVDYSVPADVTPIFRAGKSDGTGIFTDAGIVTSGNIVTVLMPEQALTAAGTVNAEINLYNVSAEKLTTFAWRIEVEASAIADSTIVSSDYYNALTALAQQILAAGMRVQILGYYTDIAALQAAVTSPNAGDIYGLTADTHSPAWVFAIYDGVNQEWIDAGDIKGPQGDPGVSVTVGTTTTGAAGSQASVSNSGTASDAVLNFSIPQGAKGDAGGLVSYVTITSTSSTLNQWSKIGSITLSNPWQQYMVALSIIQSEIAKGVAELEVLIRAGSSASITAQADIGYVLAPDAFRDIYAEIKLVKNPPLYELWFNPSSASRYVISIVSEYATGSKMTYYSNQPFQSDAPSGTVVSASMLTLNNNISGQAASVADGSVTNAKLAANAVNNAKMATMAAYTLKGNNTASAAVPQDISASNARMMLEAADVNAFSALYDAQGAVTALGLGVPSTDLSSGSIKLADNLKAPFLSAIGAWGEPVLLWGGGDALWTDGTQTIPNVRDYNYFYFQVSGSTGIILSGGRIITASGEIYVNVGAFLISGDTVNSRNICITASANSDVCSIYKRFLASHLSSSGHSDYSSQDVMSIYAIYGVKI